MDNLADTIWIELRKAIRSKMPLFTAVAFLLLPLGCALMIFIYKDPEFALKIGLISAKANLAAVTADWPAYLAFLTQGLALVGFILFSFIVSWVFGREFADGTCKDLLAVPVSRASILLAKFIVIAVWSVILTIMVVIVAFVLGPVMGLAQGSSDLILQGSVTLIITAGLVIVTVTPIALFASVGRGYLLPIGVAILTIMLTNLITLVGWGNYFPWAVPVLFAGAGRSQYGPLEAVSYAIVFLTGLAGMIATYSWWQLADQNR